jgi:hypothetical protein
MPHSDDAPQVRGQRRWCQFGLASLLMATLIAAFLVAIFGPHIERGLEWLRSLTASPDVAPQFAVPEPIVREAVVVVAADGAMALDGRKLTSAELPAALQPRFNGSVPPRVHLSCDADVPYKELMKVVDTITRAGCTQISIGVTATDGTPR